MTDRPHQSPIVDELAAPLTDVPSLFERTPDPAGLVQWVDDVANRLGVAAGKASPWTDVGRKI